MQVEIRTLQHRLTDGSTVYDVQIRDSNNGEFLTFPAVTYSDAKELCAKLAEAIESHSNAQVSKAITNTQHKESSHE